MSDDDLTLTKESARVLLNSYEDGETLTEEDARLVFAILTRHPNAKNKIRDGIFNICVRIVPPWKKNKGFYVVYADGTREDFSYLKCFSKPSPLQDFKKACRSAVVDSVLDFKRKFFMEATPTCAITGRTITPDCCHVDHAPPWTFDKIASAFMEEKRGLEFTIDDSRPDRRFLLPAVADLFRKFHDARAVLRMTSPEANLRQRRKPQ